jgi:hypothetical protein
MVFNLTGVACRKKAAVGKSLPWRMKTLRPPEIILKIEALPWGDKKTARRLLHRN